MVGCGHGVAHHGTSVGSTFPSTSQECRCANCIRTGGNIQDLFTRAVCAVLGSLWGALSFTAANGSPYVIAVFSLIFMLPMIYRFTQSTHPVSCLVTARLTSCLICYRGLGWSAVFPSLSSPLPNTMQKGGHRPPQEPRSGAPRW